MPAPINLALLRKALRLAAAATIEEINTRIEAGLRAEAADEKSGAFSQTTHGITTLAALDSGGLAVFSSDERDVMRRLQVSEKQWAAHNPVRVLNASEIAVMRTLSLSPEQWCADSAGLRTLSAGIDRETLCKAFGLPDDASDDAINQLVLETQALMPADAGGRQTLADHTRETADAFAVQHAKKLAAITPAEREMMQRMGISEETWMKHS